MILGVWLLPSCWGSQTGLINGRLKGEVRILQTALQPRRPKMVRLNTEMSLMIISVKLFGRHLWKCGHSWSIQWAPSLGMQHVPHWAVVLSCLPCWAAKWVSCSEQKRVGTSERGWQKQVLESRKTGKPLCRSASQPRPLVVVAVHWAQKDKNSNPLPVRFSCSVLLKLGCTSEHLRTLFNCRFQFSDLGAQRVSMSIQLPVMLQIPGKWWESQSKRRGTYWPSDELSFLWPGFPSPYHGFLTIWVFICNVFGTVYTFWLIDIFWGRISRALINFLLVVCLLLFHLIK